MSFVVEASIAGAWLLSKNPGAERLLERLSETGAVVPSLFWHQLRHLALTAERRVLAPGEARAMLARLRQLPLEDAGPGEDGVVLALATAHELGADDACYLALALKRDLPLATLDPRLSQAARREEIEVIGREVGS